MDKVKVSIIMPTYNVEKYFRQCLESVINQTLKDIEIIPVDDGSPDNCGKIMDEYAAKDSRIKPIHQENGGYGKAVNAGIAAATGEYIGIVETDDWCEPEMFEKLYLQAKKLDADVCKCGFYKYNSFEKDEKQNKPWKHRFENIEEFPTDKTFKITEYPMLSRIHASIWSNIYKKDFLEKNNIRLNETGLASYQDFPFMIEVVCKANKIAIIPEYHYHWRVEPNQSSSTRRSDEKLMIMAYQCEQVKKIVKEMGLYDNLKEALYSHFYSANMPFFNMIRWDLKKQYFKKIHNLFIELKEDKKFEYKYFTPKERKIVKHILNNQFYKTISLKNIYRQLVSIKWNKNEKRMVLFGKELKLLARRSK